MRVELWKGVWDSEKEVESSRKGPTFVFLLLVFFSVVPVNHLFCFAFCLLFLLPSCPSLYLSPCWRDVIWIVSRFVSGTNVVALSAFTLRTLSSTPASPFQFPLSPWQIPGQQWNGEIQEAVQSIRARGAEVWEHPGRVATCTYSILIFLT